MRGTLPRRGPVCLLSLGVLALAARSAPGASVGDRLRDASNNRHWNKHDVALKLCEGIVADAEADDRQKIGAYEITVDVFRRQGKGAEALAAAVLMRKAFPDNNEAAIRSLFAQFYCYRDTIRNHPLALARLREIARHEPDDNALVIAQVEMAGLLFWMNRFPEAYVEAEKAAGLDTRDDGRIAGALWQMMESSWRNGETAKCAKAVERLLEPKYLRHRNSKEHVGYHFRYAECKERSGRYGRDQAREYLAKMEREFKKDRPKLSQELALRIARSHFDDGHYDEAIRAYDRVFTDHADVTDHWFNAQRGMVEAHLKKGSVPEALKAARICLDVGHGGIGRNVRLAAEILRELDGDMKRANSLLDYQRLGPAGEDGKAGTADDLTDPLSPVGYPSYPGRERAFAEARAAVGDSAHASRHQALTYTFTGRPVEALARYVDAFGRCSDGDFTGMAEEMILVGLRAVRGHAAGLEPAFRFVAFGPAGPDGRPGTEDDIPDPIGPLAPAARTRAEASRSGHSAEDVRALERVRGFILGIAGDRKNRADDRRAALWTLGRVNMALADWGTPGRERYVELTLEEGDDRTQEAVVSVGQSAAKAGEYHLGGVHAFWRELDASLKAKGKGFTGRAQNRRRNFGRTVDRLAKKQRIAPRERHLKPDEDRREMLKETKREPTPEPREPDRTPPRPPAGLGTKTVSYRWAEIAWRPAEDPESGVAAYEVYRDGELLAHPKAPEPDSGETPSYVDRDLAEDARYLYTVVAVSGIGMESARGGPLTVKTPVDRERPKVEHVEASGDPERVIVVFSEAVEKESAEDPANYHISHRVRVNAASLGADSRTVTLGTSKLSPELSYALRLRGVKDRAKTPNEVDPGAKHTFEFIDTGDGLSAVYHDELGFKGKTFERIDRQVKFEWSRSDPAPGIRNTNFTVRWTGRIRPDRTGKYTFYGRTDDGVRLWVAGKLIVDAWVHRGAADSTGEIRLTAGVLYEIKMEYFQGGGAASAELHWSSESVKRQIIPQANLYSR